MVSPSIHGCSDLPGAWMLIDSHCHLTDRQFDQDREETLVRAKAAGVEKILTVASHKSDSLTIARFLDSMSGRVETPDLWGTAGIHPHDAEGAEEGDLDVIRELAEGHSRIVAIGETGLDFYYDHSPRELQEGLFRDHLALAEALSLPVVVHSRSSDEAMTGILKEWGSRVRGVLHCYTGGPDQLHAALNAGWMVSFTGLITFKKYDGQELVRSVPSDRLMVETDAPYLAPVPHRGRRNEPAFVAKVAEGLAALRSEDLEEVQGYTTENAVRFFGIG